MSVIFYAIELFRGNVLNGDVIMGYGITISEVKSYYNQICNNKKNKYGNYHSCLFHVHTPESYDYCLYESQKINDNYIKNLSLDELIEICCREGAIANKNLFDKNYDYSKQGYISLKEYLIFFLLAYKLCKSNIEVVLISDHNTINGFDKINNAVEQCRKERCFKYIPELILGIEISCADKTHIIGFFDKQNLTTRKKIKDWLSENLISVKDGTGVRTLSWTFKRPALDFFYSLMGSFLQATF